MSEESKILIKGREVLTGWRVDVLVATVICLVFVAGIAFGRGL